MQHNLYRPLLAGAAGLFLLSAVTVLLAWRPAPPAPVAAHSDPPPDYRDLQELETRERSEWGRIDVLPVESSHLGSRRNVNIYLPPGYDQGRRRYPVIYLLRGREGEWLDATSSPTRRGRNAQQITDELIRSGAIPPVILVMPPQASEDGDVIALGVNLPAPERAKGAPGVGPGRFADFLVQEVIPAVDRNYRTLPDREHRGVDGFSLGGFSSVSLALRHPHLFASVGAYEGSFLYPGGKMPDGSLDPTIVQDMAVTFGNPPDLDLVRQVNPIDLIEFMPAEALKRLSFHLQSTPPGTGDHDRVQAVVRKLAEKGVTNSFDPAYLPPGSKHGWYWADEHLKLSLVKHMAVLAR